MDGIQSGAEFIASPKNNLLFHSQYAKICSMIVKKLYSPTARSSSAVLEENQYYLKSLLDEWQRPGSKQVMLAGTTTTTSMSPPILPAAEIFSQHQQLYLMLQYSEAIFTLFQQSVFWQEYENFTDEWYRGELCVQSARDVLAETHFFEFDKMPQSWYFISIIMKCWF